MSVLRDKKKPSTGGTSTILGDLLESAGGYPYRPSRVGEEYQVEIPPCVRGRPDVSNYVPRGENLDEWNPDILPMEKADDFTGYVGQSLCAGPLGPIPNRMHSSQVFRIYS